MSGRGEVTIWGTGTPRREFLHSDDLADALRFLLENYHLPEIINVGCGQDLTIRELAEIIAAVVAHDIEIRSDPSRPDGTPQKLLDCSRLQALGWEPRISLKEGIAQTYRWLMQNIANVKGWNEETKWAAGVRR
jgi:GDP-L-fucose synthase